MPVYTTKLESTSTPNLLSQPPELLSALHSASEARISFSDNNGKPFTSVRPAELADTWPAITPRLDGDLYFTINAVSGRRRDEDVRTLNALWIDIDHKLSGVDPEEAKRRVLANLGPLPKPTFFVYSGTGLWAIWKIQPLDGGWRAVWQRVEERLIERFAHIGADPSAKNPARIMRVPGSRNSKNGRVVRAERFADTETTLTEMAALVGVRARKQTLTREEENRPSLTLAERRQKQQAAHERWKRNVDRIWQLAEMRGKFGRGHRANALWALGQSMRWNGADGKEIRTALTKMGREHCAPALTMAEINHHWRSVETSLKRRFDWRSGNLSKKGMLKMLAICAPEEIVLWPTRFTKQADIRERRKRIASMLASAPNLSVRQLQKLYEQRHGKISRGTIANDRAAVLKRPSVQKTRAIRTTVVVSKLHPSNSTKKLDTLPTTPLDDELAEEWG